MDLKQSEAKKNKLLQVVNDAFVLPYFIGQQFSYFKNRDVEQFVACTPSKFLREYITKIDIQYFEVSILRSISPLNDLLAVWKLFRIIKTNNITHVFGHTPKGAMVAMIAAYLAKVQNRVYFRHGLVYETSSGFKRKLLILIEKMTAGLATKIVNVSPSVLNKALKDRIGHEKNIILSRGTCNGINIDRFSDDNKESRVKSNLLKQTLKISVDDFVVGFVGRLVKDKGISDLVDAWRIVEKRGFNMKLLLVGPFEERDGLPEDVKTYILNSQSIIHIDFIEDVVPYYQLMDVLILPSYREGFPTVVLEASSMSIPVLTTKVTGCVDSIIEDHTGLYIKHDTQDIVDKIDFYFHNRDIASNHGKNGREFVETFFKQETVWKEIEEKLILN